MVEQPSPQTCRTTNLLVEMNKRRIAGVLAAAISILVLPGMPTSAQDAPPAVPPTSAPAPSPDGMPDPSAGPAPLPIPVAPVVDPAVVSAMLDANSKLAELDAQITKGQAELQQLDVQVLLTQAEIAELTRDIENTTNLIELAERKIAAIRDILRDRAISNYVAGGTEETRRMSAIMSAESPLEADFVITMLESAAKADDELARDLANQRDLRAKRRDRLDDRKASVEAKAAELAEMVAERKQVLFALGVARAEAQVQADRAQAALATAQAAVDAERARLEAEGWTVDGTTVALDLEGRLRPGLTLAGQPLCDADGITVDCAVAPNVVLMVRAAAKDGVVLTGGGWRSTEQQIRLRAAHCGGDVFGAASSSCSPPTARPGASQHEFGLAIDFENCSSRTTACYQWLAQNAATFGYKNLPSEPWHWSTTGH